MRRMSYLYLYVAKPWVYPVVYRVFLNVGCALRCMYGDTEPQVEIFVEVGGAYFEASDAIA
jgi:hypothetical protein